MTVADCNEMIAASERAQKAIQIGTQRRHSKGYQQAVEAIRGGRSVVLPTDTVYGLCGDPRSEKAAQEIYRLKGRPAAQPLALLAADAEALFELVPELPRSLLAGPYTLVLPNPAERFRWLTGSSPVRIPSMSPKSRSASPWTACRTRSSANPPISSRRVFSTSSSS